MKTRNSSAVSVAIVTIFLSASMVFASDFYWQSDTGGIFSDSNSWIPAGPPGAADRARFQLLSTYTVFFDQHFTNDRLFINAGDVTFENPEYSLEHSSESAIIGYDSAARLTVTGYGNIETRSTTIGNSAGSDGELVVREANWIAYKSSDGWHPIWVGHSGNGKLTIENGAGVIHGHGVAGMSPQGNGVITVNDGRWYVDGWFGLGYYGTAQLLATGGTQIRMGICEMAVEPDSNALAIIDSTPWYLANLSGFNLVIGKRGSATVELKNDAVLTVVDSMAIAQYPGSFGRLVNNGCQALVNDTVYVGGSADSPGGTGVIELNAGIFSVGQAADDIMLIWPDSKVYLRDDATLELDFGSSLGTIYVKGLLAGYGYILANVVNESGVIAPGEGASADPKFLAMDENYTQASGGTLKIQIEGPELISQYSQLYIENYAQLDGQLHVDLADGFIPAPDDSFTILEAWSGITGTFSNAQSIYTFSGGTFDVVYDFVSVTLTDYRPLPACVYELESDINGDCKADFLDLAAFTGEWLESTPQSTCVNYPKSDYNGDCIVDLLDFAVLAGEWLECSIYPPEYCGI